MNAKTLLLAAAMIATENSGANAEPLSVEDRVAIIDTITDVAAGADRHQWERVRNALSSEVTLDYTSLWGGSPTTQSGADIVAQWSGFLPGFDQTLHLVTNHAIVESGQDKAVAEADFQASHRIGQDLWVLLGHYRYQLAKQDGDWKITGLTMVYTHEWGDRDLVRRAGERNSAK